MTWESWGIIITAAGFLVTLMMVVFNAGQFKANFESLKEWFVRENERNSKQHEEFYQVRNQVTTLVADHSNMERRLDSIEEKLDTVISGINNIAAQPRARRRST